MPQSSPSDRTAAAGRVARLLAHDLVQPVAPFVSGFVTRLLGGTQPLGVIFYGSTLRTPDPEGILDFYVIVERLEDWTAGTLSREANRILPPNVEYHEITIEGRIIRAKVAILSIAQFRRMTGRATLDTTVWARFCQPVRLVWVRGPEAADAILACIIRAVAQAGRWAAVLGPAHGTADKYWLALFAHTYGAELRVENGRRPKSLLQGQETRYRTLLPDIWRADGLPFTCTGDELSPRLTPELRQTMRKGWWLRGRLGRVLNVSRLFKAAFTFEGGARYIAWKIRRHSGIELPLGPFSERHPLICLPYLLWKLRQAGFFRRRD
ncbi:hypothetical protein LU298_09215 [Komagataeibacter intermedius]|uniref:Uncharacterized protein n=2 Tax=Komagataeibacter intermedius TaxID=66229 RepID=A0A0N1N5G1_9PROT|nr:hypothetical protein [Komagataeibacter intermedius]KPH87100.1 hypothetical protein GLUCOINTEAF2_0202331 [Komagataeibacter intermedius AF2]MCF3636679.1 hypothetical protein [Komagataeibacter intermedius]GAN88174.1 hypothetical protein Gain_0144_042 [Komagataeibacter intermedius TF2]GBQ69092.1 hypothetical protein AA0521_1388 [Komagataeibacter intermedius NRIC 0521]